MGSLSLALTREVNLTTPSSALSTIWFATYDLTTLWTNSADDNLMTLATMFFIGSSELEESDRESHPEKHPCKIKLKFLEQMLMRFVFFPLPWKPENCLDPKDLKKFKRRCWEDTFYEVSAKSAQRFQRRRCLRVYDGRRTTDTRRSQRLIIHAVSKSCRI